MVSHVGNGGGDNPCAGIKTHRERLLAELHEAGKMGANPIPLIYGKETMHNQEQEKVWYAYARNCGNDESCCKDWFSLTREPVTHSEAVQAIKNNFDVWYEYAVVHTKFTFRYVT